MPTIGETTRPGFVYDSATDTWIPVGIGPHSHTPAAIGAISSSLVTTKGDLIVATGSGTVVRQGVGADGSVLMADSSQADGVNWAGPSNTAGKNVLINGAMDWWQRGTSFAATPANFTYMSDRWYWIGATASVIQETSIVPTNFRYAIKATATGTTQPVFGQTIETANCYQLAGQTVTLSAWVATSNASDVTLRLEFSTSVDNPSNGTWTTITSTSGSNSVSATSTMARRSLVFSVPANALSLRVTIYTSGNVSSGTTLTMTGAQLELGSVATAFSRAGGSIGGELTLCQRYYYRATSAVVNVWFGVGNAGASNAFYPMVSYKTTMRSSLSSIDYSNLGWWNGGSVTVASSININQSAPDFAMLTVNTSGLTAGNSYLLGTGSGGGFIGFNAEL